LRLLSDTEPYREGRFSASAISRKCRPTWTRAVRVRRGRTLQSSRTLDHFRSHRSEPHVGVCERGPKRRSKTSRWERSGPPATRIKLDIECWPWCCIYKKPPGVSTAVSPL
jgi:hypothetical protein